MNWDPRPEQGHLQETRLEEDTQEQDHHLTDREMQWKVHIQNPNQAEELHLTALPTHLLHEA